MYAPKLYRFDLRKAASGGERPGHKYFKRIMTGDAKNPWHYYYTQAEYEADRSKGAVPGLHAHDLKPGSAVTINRTVWTIKEKHPSSFGAAYTMVSNDGVAGALTTTKDGYHELSTYSKHGPKTVAIKNISIGGEQKSPYPEKFETSADYSGEEVSLAHSNEMASMKEYKALSKEAKRVWKDMMGAARTPEAKEKVRNALLQHYHIQRMRLRDKYVASGKLKHVDVKFEGREKMPNGKWSYGYSGSDGTVIRRPTPHPRAEHPPEILEDHKRSVN